MYDFKFGNGEQVNNIIDSVKVYIGDDIKEITCIITNKRLLFLDYPSKVFNSMEDLRISGKMNYIRKKEVVDYAYLDDISVINKLDRYTEIELKDGRYINIDNGIIKFLKERKWKKNKKRN